MSEDMTTLQIRSVKKCLRVWHAKCLLCIILCLVSCHNHMGCIAVKKNIHLYVCIVKHAVYNRRWGSLVTRGLSSLIFLELRLVSSLKIFVNKLSSYSYTVNHVDKPSYANIHIYIYRAYSCQPLHPVGPESILATIKKQRKSSISKSTAFQSSLISTNLELFGKFSLQK